VSVYRELQTALRESLLPESLVNPLGLLAGTRDLVLQQQQHQHKIDSGSSSENGDGDGYNNIDGEWEAEKVDEGKEMETGVDTSEEEDAVNQQPFPMTNSDQDIDLSGAYEEARAMLLENVILDMKLEQMRASLDKGLLPADTRFSFQVAFEPDDLIDWGNMDEEEKEFAEKLEELIGQWNLELERVDLGARGELVDDSDESWNSKIQDQKVWEEIEMERLREEMRETHLKTLTGHEVKDPDFYGNDEYVEDDHNEKRTSAPKNKGGEGNAVEIQGDVGAFASLVRAAEREISYWASTDKRTVLVWGSKAYVGRDYENYASAFTKAGWDVEKKKGKEGPLHMKTLAANEHPVLICLALKNDDCFSSSGLAKLQRYHHVNRILGLRAVLWSKDSFCKTLSKGVQGEKLFSDYVFHCFIFPAEWSAAKEYAQQHPDASFIVKPLTMGGGKGITVVDGEKELSKLRFKTHIVQNYLSNPHLIHQHKWDIRTYVLVTSTVPMRAYVYSDGIIRFASKAYDPNARKGGKKSQFLTNTSVNKKFVKQNVTEITWAFNDLRDHFSKTGEDFEALFKRIQIAISIVFLSAEQEWRRYYHSGHSDASCSNCFQILGVDLIVDSEMKPRVIEVNGQPSMKLSKGHSDRYSHSKMNMMSDMVAMMFRHEDPVADELLSSMSEIDENILKSLSTSEWEYLIKYTKERKHPGQWKKAYPNFENDRLHSAFLEQQKRNPARLALHDVLMHLEQK